MAESMGGNNKMSYY